MIIKNITKKYDGKIILDDISLNIKKGCINAFIGPNGGGKSTLLKIISRLVEKDKGEILIDNIEISKWNSNELAKKISILTQKNEINVKITVFELISFGRFPYKEDKDNKVEEAINLLDLNEIRDKYIDEISGGQLQRALIAMIIAQDTEYILLDEPNNNLDIYHSKKLMQLLKLLCEKYNKTVIIVLHEINYASFYSDYIFCISNGKIKYEGLTENIICKEILKDLYNIDFEIINFKDKQLTLFY